MILKEFYLCISLLNILVLDELILRMNYRNCEIGRLRLKYKNNMLIGRSFLGLPKMFCVKKLCPHGKMPCRGSIGAAGYDLYSSKKVMIKAWGRVLVGTGISISLPVGVYGRIASRSGLSLNYGLEVGGGVIDRDYTGEVGVILYNHTCHDYIVEAGDRVAQLVLERCAHFVVEEVDELYVASERGDGGFGSTGV